MISGQKEHLIARAGVEKARARAGLEEAQAEIEQAQAKMKAAMARLEELEEAEGLAKGKRTGRPIKTPRKGKRSRISVDVSDQTKALILGRAKASGRTLGREAEIMIESAVTYERAMTSMRLDLDNIDHGPNELVDAALQRRGYISQRQLIGDKTWKVWAEPGHPYAEPSSFKEWEPGELEALQERARILEEARSKEAAPKKASASKKEAS
jgi:hypothetical protein